VDAAPLRAGRPADLWVLALDAYGHLATGYTGVVAFVSTTDPAAQLPAPVTFAPGGFAHLAGAVTFSAAGMTCGPRTWSASRPLRPCSASPPWP
jgi:hypothetical protein